MVASRGTRKPHGEELLKLVPERPTGVHACVISVGIHGNEIAYMDPSRYASQSRIGMDETTRLDAMQLKNMLGKINSRQC